jgi:hypothetical protein
MYDSLDNKHLNPACLFLLLLLHGKCASAGVLCLWSAVFVELVGMTKLFSIHAMEDDICFISRTDPTDCVFSHFSLRFSILLSFEIIILLTNSGGQLLLQSTFHKRTNHQWAGVRSGMMMGIYYWLRLW